MTLRFDSKMNGLEIALLVIGIIAFAASFIFSSALDGGTEDNKTKDSKAELSDRQREEIRKQIETVIADETEDIKERTEVELDRMSAKKMSEMTEYSETILNEINRNHNEVMFLYDMLNEKKKEVKNTVRDLDAAKRELNSTMSVNQTNSPKTEAPHSSGEKSQTREKSASILDQLDASSMTVSDEMDDDTVPYKRKSTRKTGRAAADRLRTALKSDSVRHSSVDNANRDKILELDKRGKSPVEIARELNIGVGEVKLITDLYRGDK